MVFLESEKIVGIVLRWDCNISNKPKKVNAFVAFQNQSQYIHFRNAANIKTLPDVNPALHTPLYLDSYGG